MLIFINRKIVKALLEKDETLANEYIAESIIIADEDFNYGLDEKVRDIAEKILEVIKSNEKVIEKFGIETYKTEEYPVKYYESGCRRVCGIMFIIPFDWSIDEDNNFNYSFELAKIL